MQKCKTFRKRKSKKRVARDIMRDSVTWSDVTRCVARARCEWHQLAGLKNEEKEKKKWVLFDAVI